MRIVVIFLKMFIIVESYLYFVVGENPISNQDMHFDWRLN